MTPMAEPRICNAAFGLANVSGNKYFLADQAGIHFLTLTVVDWIDVFARRNHKGVIAESLNRCIGDRGLIVGQAEDHLYRSAMDYAGRRDWPTSRE
jgi:hypothetical protein